MTLYLSACTVTVRPLLILKEIRTNNAMRINCTPPWHYVEEAAEVHVGCLEPSSDNYVYLHNQIHGSDISNAFITLLLFFTKSRNSLQNCSRLTLSRLSNLHFVQIRYKSEGHGFHSRWRHWNFSLTKSFRPHYGHEVDFASNRNEYQKYFLGVMAAGA